jgi:hypothetical protein
MGVRGNDDSILKTIGEYNAENDIELKISNVSAHLELKICELEKLFTDEYFNVNDFYVAGGCIYSLWNNKEPKDYDVFCKNKKAINKLKCGLNSIQE